MSAVKFIYMPDGAFELFTHFFPMKPVVLHTSQLPSHFQIMSKDVSPRGAILQ